VTRLPTILCLGLLALSCAGCGQVRNPFVPTPRLETVRDEIPADMLKAVDEPLAPLDEPRPSNGDFAAYVLELQLWGREGWARVGKIGERQAKNGAAEAP
jgi:hypothetical protein